MCDDVADLLPFDQGGSSFILSKGADKILKIQPITSPQVIDDSNLESMIHKTLCETLKTEGIFGIPEFYTSTLEYTIPEEIVKSLNSNIKKGSRRFTSNYPCTITQMERLDGENMKEILLGGRNNGRTKLEDLSRDEIKNIFLQLAIILDFLDNKCGFKHNDFKLQNIILRRNSTPGMVVRYERGNSENWEFCLGDYSAFLVDFGCSQISLAPPLSDEMNCFTSSYLPLKELVFLEPGKKFIRSSFRGDSWCYGLCLYYSVYSGWLNNFGMDNSEWVAGQTAFKSSAGRAGSFVLLFWTVGESHRHRRFNAIKKHLFEILRGSMTGKQRVLDAYYDPLMFLVLGVYLTCKLVFGIPLPDSCKGSVYYECLRYLEDNPETMDEFETMNLADGDVRFFSQLTKTQVIHKLGKKGTDLVKQCLSSDPQISEIITHDFFEDFFDPADYEQLLDSRETLTNRGMLLRIVV